MNFKQKRSSTPNALECFYVPYSHNELAESRSNRKFITSLSELSARLWMCVHFAENAYDAVFEGNYIRAYGYFKYLDIGDVFNQNSLTAAIQKVRAQIIAAGEGNAPRTKSIETILRVLATYIQLRREIHVTSSIFDVDCAGRSLESILCEHQIICGDHERYEKHINEIFDRLLNGLTDHYSKTCAFLCAKVEQQREKYNQLTRTPKKLNKGRGKHTPFMDQQLEIFKSYLEKFPVTASYSKIVRARACWHLHKTEWDKAAKNGKGYNCYKTLASAV